MREIQNKMELKEPRRKKRCQLKPPFPLPLIKTSDNAIYKFSGHFNGFSIIINRDDEMKKLNSMGGFGKGNLSRGYPLFNRQEGQVEVVRRRVFTRRKEWSNTYQKNAQIKKIVVVPDSESDNEDYFVNLKPEFQLDSSTIKEILKLFLEEAFYLCASVQCLSIFNDSTLLDPQDTWKLFCDSDKNFIQNYPVYHYFRSKNWIVKPGLKFGGDFLLYKEGPAFYHASYVVIIDVLDSKTLQRRDDMCRRSMEIMKIVGLNRLCETVGKELLICQLLWPAELTEVQPEDITKLAINEVVMRRWVSSQHRETPD